MEITATLYASFTQELQKLAASRHRMAVSQSRSGRRSMHVDTLLKKDRNGSLWKDHLPGGLADKKTPADFPPEKLREGRKVESEHTSNPAIQTEIAMDHITEDPNYYPKLKKMEKDAYRLQGHTTFQGLPIAIENRKGSVREGVDEDGKPWRSVFKLPYGYIKKTEGNDGEEIDAFIGPHKDAPKAFIVHQRKITDGSFDEDKVLLGLRSKAEARKVYLDHYDGAGPKLLGPITAMMVEELRRRLREKRKHTKLAASGSGPSGNPMPLVDMEDRPEKAKPGDVPSKDGVSPGEAKVEKYETGQDSATMLPTNAALSGGSASGALTRF
jgi:hypothetical protein